jgi:hypothetical protein
MPRHSKEKSSDGAAAGGAGRGTRAAAAAEGGDSKRGAGGRAIGKAALQARRKNAGAIADFLDMIEGVSTYGELEDAITRDGLRLARVVKSLGCGHLDVQLHDGRSVVLKIAKSVAFKGRAASKADRENCMLAGDLIVVRDAMAAGKIPVALVRDLAEEFTRVGAAAPSGFFTQGSEADAGAVGWEFDRRPELARAGVRAAAVVSEEERALGVGARARSVSPSAAAGASGAKGGAGGDEEEDFALEVDAI